MNVDEPAICRWCRAPIQQPKTGRRRRYCGGTCRKAASRARQSSWDWLESNDPPLAKLPTGVATDAPPSPDDSTVADVSLTVVTAVALVAELRRHSVAAPGLLAAKCDLVASALDEVLVREFGDVL